MGEGGDSETSSSVIEEPEPSPKRQKTSEPSAAWTQARDRAEAGEEGPSVAVEMRKGMCSDGEKERFWEGYKECGRSWSKIAREFIKSRTTLQVGSFAQNHNLMKPRQGVTLHESIRVVLSKAGQDGMRLKKIVQAIQEDDELYDLSGRKDSNYVSVVLADKPHLFTNVSRGVWKLRSTQP